MRTNLLLFALLLAASATAQDGDGTAAGTESAIAEDTEAALLDLINADFADMPLDENGIPLDRSLALTDQAMERLWAGIGVTDALLLALTIYVIRIHLKLAEIKGRLGSISTPDDRAERVGNPIGSNR